MKGRFFLFWLLSGSLTACGGGSDSNSNSDTQTLGGLQGAELKLDGSYFESKTVTATLTHPNSEVLSDARISFQWFDEAGAIWGADSNKIQLTASDIDKNIYATATVSIDGKDARQFTSPSFTVESKIDLLTFFDESYRMQISLGAAENDAWAVPESPWAASGDDYIPTAVSDGKGNIIVAWQSEYSPDFGGEYDIVYSRSTDNGQTWSERSLLNAADTNDSESDEDVSLATDGNGTWVAVWSSNEDINGAGTDSDIVFVVSTDNGETWTTPNWLNDYAMSETKQDWQPRVKVFDNHWIVVWVSNFDLDGGISSDRDILFSYSDDKGVSWSSPEYLNSAAQSDLASDADYFPELDINANGIGAAIWSAHHGDDDLDIYAAITSDFGKTWSTSQRLNSYGATDGTTHHDYARHIEVSSTGKIVASWEGENPANGTDSDAYYSFSEDTGMTWAVEQTLNTDASLDNTQEEFVQISTDNSGSWYGLWSDAAGGLWMRRSNDLTNWSDAAKLSSDNEEGFEFLIH
ncbi:hypothetical protein RN22_09905 [Grimontia sp. AD028]|uniref:sialidase family protein n=1 Tax=Grimontia sp. AD028 TaxID=1581149 RepID=UPI00061AD26B|nr:sialidase family protein [Grimontia sp. AD028]KKD60609.1 hypothetical protein RN22_09905 [Grimontia sp. AD028]